MARNILGVIRQFHLLKLQCLFIHPPLNPEQTDTDDSQHAFGITAEESESWKSLNFKEKDSLLRAAERIHANTGHRPPSELAKIMRQQGAPLNARAAMEHVKCSSCKENARPTARPVVSMEMATVPWHTVGIDIKEITTPEKQKEKYLVRRRSRSLHSHNLSVQLPAGRIPECQVRGTDRCVRRRLGKHLRPTIQATS